MPWSRNFSLHGVETASLTQSTAKLVQFWSSAGPTLRRVDPLHLGGLHGGNSAFHTSPHHNQWVVTSLLQRLRPPARKLMLCGGS